MSDVALKTNSDVTRFGGKIRIASALAALLLGPGLSGCILGSEKPELGLEVPATYREGGHHAPDAAVPALDWWRGFRSSELTKLMEAAQIYNLDIAVAIAQIIQADAQVGVSGAPLLPSVTGTGTVENQHFGSSSAAQSSSGLGGSSSGGGSTFNSFNFGLTASYMLDFWGKNRATLYGAEESATVARYNREVVTLTTIVTVANTYFQVLAAQDELRVARRNLTAAERILALIKTQFAAGTASQLDLSQQEALVATVRASIPPLEVTLRQSIATLALLVARAPANFNVNGGGFAQLTVPRVTPGLPSELLYQRPDVRQAEAQLASSNFSVESARAAFFPQIQLTATTGVQSAALAALFGYLPGAQLHQAERVDARRELDRRLAVDERRTARRDRADGGREQVDQAGVGAPAAPVEFVGAAVKRERGCALGPAGQGRADPRSVAGLARFFGCVEVERRADRDQSGPAAYEQLAGGRRDGRFAEHAPMQGDVLAVRPVPDPTAAGAAAARFFDDQCA